MKAEPMQGLLFVPNGWEPVITQAQARLRDVYSIVLKYQQARAFYVGAVALMVSGYESKTELEEAINYLAVCSEDMTNALGAVASFHVERCDGDLWDCKTCRVQP